MAGAALTIWLLARTWKHRKTAPFATIVVASLLAASALFGTLGTLMGLAKALGAVGGESVDPSQKAHILAEGISEAMNCTAVGLVLWLPSVAAFIVTLTATHPVWPAAPV